jgi:hypothetical protein
MVKTASPSYEQPQENVARKKTLPATKARAGLMMDRDTLYMMIFGTLLTILLFGAIFLVYGDAG